MVELFFGRQQERLDYAFLLLASSVAAAVCLFYTLYLRLGLRPSTSVSNFAHQHRFLHTSLCLLRTSEV